MPKWEFIDGLTRKLIESYDPAWRCALEAALESRATPFQSGYYVNTGAVTKRGHIVSGANHEMAITDTVTHGEEAVIAAALDRYGKDDPIQVIAFAGQESGISSPCGNCRDAIRQYTDLNNLVVIGAPRIGGTAVLVKGKTFFTDSFKEATEEEKERLFVDNLVYHVLKAEKNAYDIYLTESSPKIYGAVIVCENGMAFRGSFRGDVAYHPVLPISAAISNFRDGSDDLSRKDVKSIVVAATGRIPDVMYKDRQHALEFAEAIQELNEKPGISLPVYLVNIGKIVRTTKVFKTDTKEWLPFSFSPKHLGLAKEVAAGYEKLFEK